MKTRILAVVLLTFTVAGAALAGGDGTNIRGMGMGRTYVAASRGLDAFGVNPANLAFEDGNTVSFSLVPLGTTVGTNFMTYGLYTKYFTGVETDSGRVGRYLGDAEKQEILDAFPDGLGNVIGHAEVRPFGLAIRAGSIGTFAITITEQFHGNFQIPREYVEFLLYGNTPGNSLDFQGTQGAAQWTREYGFAYAREIPSFLVFEQVVVGGAVKMVHGFAHIDIPRFNTSLQTGADGTLDGQLDAVTRISQIDALKGGEFDPFPAPAGSGVAYDLGISGTIGEYLTLGMSMTDIGSLRWTRNIEESVASGVIHIDDITDQAQRDSLENAVKGETGPGSAFTTSLPTMFRVGASVELHKLRFFRKFLFGELTAACDVNKCLEPSAGLTPALRFSSGLEYRPIRAIQIRMGFSTGGLEGTAFAMGLGVHVGFFELDIASGNLWWLFDQDALSQGSLAAGIKLVF
jgi:hypothetical protein